MRGSVDNVTLVVMVAVLLGAPTASRASTVIPMSLETMARHAGQVIVRTVFALHTISFIFRTSFCFHGLLLLLHLQYLHNKTLYLGVCNSG